MKVITEADTPKGVLEEMLKRAEHFDLVIVLALNKDSTQCLMTSHESMINKVFLVQFAQSWITRWFEHE